MKNNTSAIGFTYATSLLSGTDPDQKVTKKNIGQLPCGSVVRLADGGRLIHLHDDLWLWCSDHAHCYDKIEHLVYKLERGAKICHVAPSNSITPP